MKQILGTIHTILLDLETLILESIILETIFITLLDLEIILLEKTLLETMTILLDQEQSRQEARVQEVMIPLVHPLLQEVVITEEVLLAVGVLVVDVEGNKLYNQCIYL
jgi:hypothetical protein